MDILIHSGDKAPDFSLNSLEGDLYHLYARLGKVIILNFWSAECPWSARGDQEILAALAAWGGRAALWTIVANANEPVEMVRKEAQRRGLPLVLLDTQQQVANLYGAKTTPHCFVIDPNGRLRYQGAMNDITFRQRTSTRSYLQDAIAALLAGSDPQPSETPPYGCMIVRHAE
jgi:peroxiredoxin